MARVVVYSTLGGNEKVIDTNARVLKDLIPDLQRAGINSSGMKLVVGETQVTLESSEASLPDLDNWTLFLTAQKVKSGYEDTEMIDDYDGIEWSEVDWSDDSNNVTDFTFLSIKDLNLARMKKAEALLEKASRFFTVGSVGSGSEGKKSSLAEMARNIQNNIDMFS